MAWWDLLGKATGLPVCDLLGGRVDGPVHLHSSISTGTPEEMIEIIRRARDKGYRIHSATIGVDVDLDIERIRFINKNRISGESVTFEVNRAWLADQAPRVMNATRDGMSYFEQPCETLEQCRTVRKRTMQPIVLDESIQSFCDLLRAHSGHICEAGVDVTEWYGTIEMGVMAYQTPTGTAFD